MSYQRKATSPTRADDAHLWQPKYEAFLAALRAGLHPDAAATVAGVAKDLLRRWRKEIEHDPSDLATLDMLQRAQQAITEAELEAVSSVRAAWTDGDWRAAAWYLERRHRERWGERKGLDVSGEVIVKRVELDASVLEAARARLVRPTSVRTIGPAEVTATGTSPDATSDPDDAHTS